MSNAISFFLNGEEVILENPSPDLMLIDYLRSPEVRLVGAKKGCGQGGCGACTVILSYKDESNKLVHRSFNSCLRPVVSLNGMSVTTVEGTGSVMAQDSAYLKRVPSASRTGAIPSAISKEWDQEIIKAQEQKEKKKQSKYKQDFVPEGVDHPFESSTISPVAKALAENNGTQCGYCSTGFVMNMTAFIKDHPNATKQEIENIFDGNICRCTGFRAILTGMKTFASDWNDEDKANRMDCITEDGFDEQMLDKEEIVIRYAPESEKAEKRVAIHHENKQWLTPLTLDELRTAFLENKDKKIRLVHSNTSFGIYPNEFHASEVYLDVRLIAELEGLKDTEDHLVVGAGVTYTNFIYKLEEMGFVENDNISELDRHYLTNLGATHFMARRTAGTIVRNTASLGGNTMLILHHIFNNKEGRRTVECDPFPSDLGTILATMDTLVDFMEISTGERKQWTYTQLVEHCVASKSNAYAADIVLIRFHIPKGKKKEITLSQKVAARQVNSHTIVNIGTQFIVEKDRAIKSVKIVFGGIAPYPWHASKTEAYLEDKTLSHRTFYKVQAMLEEDIETAQKKWKSRMASTPNEGYTDAYKKGLAVSFLYKAIVNALLVVDPDEVPEEVQSAGLITWGRWGISDGTQFYSKAMEWRAPVSKPYIKLAAIYQASGQVHYTHELDFPNTGYNAAFIHSRRALANFHFALKDEQGSATIPAIEKHLKGIFPSFVRLVTIKDLPTGGHNKQGIGADQPLFAKDQVSYVGQVIAMVLADTEANAIKIAEYAEENCIAYTEVELEAPWNKPVLSIEQAIKQDSIFPDYPSTAPFYSHIWRITRPGSEFYWTKDKAPTDKKIKTRKTEIEGNPCLVVENTQKAGGQVHFYMETQSAVAFPHYGGRVTVHPSTQSPMEMHQTVAYALAKDLNQVEIQVQQVGGGFGGKTEQTRFVTGPTAVAAYVTQKPVRLVMPRDKDTSMIGKRHPYYGQYQIAVDMGKNRAEDKGIIRGMQTKLYGDGGAFYDCSYIVSNCIQLRTDNAYNVRHFQSQIDVCRTNKAPNTAMRAFGDIQGKLITENAIDDAAFELGMEPTVLREKNMYRRGDVTPFGQALSYCYMRDVWDYVKKVSKYEKRKEEVEAFNAKNKWRKRGIYIVPVKYGSGYNLVQLEQASTVMSVYSADGTIVIHQGGVDMGQGLMTIAEQVASYILNVPMELIRIEHPKTGIIPNPTSTGASTGTPYSAEAIKQACEELKSRMMSFVERMRKENGDAFCKINKIDYWNYPEKGWATVVEGSSPTIMWQHIITMAYAQRESLVVSHNVKVSGGTTPVPALSFKPLDLQPRIPDISINEEWAKEKPGGAVDSFSGFTFSAACSEVELDVLTGEVKILQSDIVYDSGWSINPAIDIGQVEGAFVQGIGNVMTEKLVFEESGEEIGRLNTVNTWRYKPPANVTIPLQLNTHLFPRNNGTGDSPEDCTSRDSQKANCVPDNPHNLLSAKEVGEPPLVLASSVFFAIKAAIRDSRLERDLSGLFRFDAPATVEEVKRACEVDL